MSEVLKTGMDYVRETNSDFDAFNYVKDVAPQQINQWTTIEEALELTESCLSTSETLVGTAKGYLAGAFAFGAVSFTGFAEMATKEEYTESGELLLTSGFVGLIVMSSLMSKEFKKVKTFLYEAGQAQSLVDNRLKEIKIRLEHYNDPTLYKLYMQGKY